MEQVKVLSSDTQKGEFLFYMVLDFPFPLQDRDLRVPSKIVKEAFGTIRVKNTAMDKGYERLCKKSELYGFSRVRRGLGISKISAK